MTARTDRTPARCDSSTARQTARSWMASPVESKSVVASGEERPGAAPVSTAPRSVTWSRDTRSACTAPVSSPPWAACSHSSQNSSQRATASTSASALPGPSAPSMLRCAPGRRSAARTTGSEPGVTQVTTWHASASSRLPASQPSSPASAPAASGSGSKQIPGPYSAAARQRAAQAPCSPQPTMPAVRASSRASSCAAIAATAPVRSAVTARTSSSASGSPDSADETQIIPITTGRPAAGLPGNDVTHLRIASPRALGRHRAEVAVGRRVEVDLRRHHPLAARVLHEAVANALDRVERRDRPQHGVVVERGDLGHRAPEGTLPATVSRNGRQRPRRPRIEIQQAASPEEAAAIAAAIEQFLRDTAPPPAPAEQPSRWGRTALREGVGLPPEYPQESRPISVPASQ